MDKDCLLHHTYQLSHQRCEDLVNMRLLEKYIKLRSIVKKVGLKKIKTKKFLLTVQN